MRITNKPIPPPDYDCDDKRPSNVVHSDDVPVNPIARDAWCHRIANGELIVIDHPKHPGGRPGERKVKRIRA